MTDHHPTHGDPVPHATASPDPVHAPRQRLHPLSPVLRGAKSLGVVIAAVSWQGFARFGVTVGGLIVLIAGLLGLAWSWITWYFTGYRIIGRELHIHDGVLSRRHRVIRLDRLQSVEVVRPLLARLTGLAELRCEVVGATRTEAPLAYLTIADATALRARLLALSRGSEPELEPSDAAEEPTAVPTETAPTAPVTRPEPPLVAVPANRLIQSQLLTPQVLLIPVAAAFTIAMFVWQPDMTFFGLAGLVTATAGILLKPVRQAAVDYRFTLDDTSDGMRIRRGLTEQRTQTLPLNRVTAVRIRRPLLWRAAGWLNVEAANAGAARPSANDLVSRAILPVGTGDQARRVAAHALGGTDITTVRLRPAPRRARWCTPIGQPALGAALAEEVFVTRVGRITPKLVAVPYARIQSVRVVQKRLPRALGLATVHVDIAGGLGIAAQARHRDVDEALDLAARLAELSRRHRNPAAT